jgi:hypothetical protein
MFVGSDHMIYSRLSIHILLCRYLDVDTTYKDVVNVTDRADRNTDRREIDVLFQACSLQEFIVLCWHTGGVSCGQTQAHSTVSTSVLRGSQHCRV